LGRFDVALSTVVVAFVVMVPAFAIGVQWGLVGLSLAWLFGTPVMFLLNMRQNMTVLKTPISSLLAGMARPAVAGVVMYGTIAACRATAVAEFAAPVRLGLLILVGALAYVATTFALNRRAAQRLCTRMIRWLDIAVQGLAICWQISHFCHPAARWCKAT
jgi:teichuronic acid exporter